MRRYLSVIAMLGLTATAAIGTVGAGASQASPGFPGQNYGHCVSAGYEKPSTSQYGPFGENSNTPTGNTGEANSRVQSGGHSHFTFGHICASQK